MSADPPKGGAPASLPADLAGPATLTESNSRMDKTSDALRAKPSPPGSAPVRLSVSLVLYSLAAAAIGALSAGIALPRKALEPWNLNWLTGDLWQVYGAWSTYMSEQRWPALVTDSFSYPMDLSISLFDPMPIFLWLAKALPVGWPAEQFQLFGWYFVLCLTLSGLFGTFLTRQVLQDFAGDRRGNDLLAAAGGVLIATLPANMWRFAGHTALSSQWLVVLSLWLQLSTRSASLGRYLAINLPVILLASGINPYLTLMMLMPVTVIAVVERAAGRISISNAVLRPVVLGATALLGFWLFGFLSGAARGIDGGYGLYSMNVLAPIDSNGYGGIWTVDIPDATGGQSGEGFNYFGFGLLALIGCLLVSRREVLEGARRDMVVTLLGIAAFAFIASLSYKVTLAGSTVLQIPLPAAFMDILSKFRSTGRFFWLAGFAIVPLAIAAVSVRLGFRGLAVVLSVVLAVQAIDLWAVFWEVRERIHGGERYRAAEISLAPAVDTATIIPPWQCDIDFTPGTRRGYELVGDYKERYGLRLNSFYTARTSQALRDYHCDPANWLQDGRGNVASIYLVSTDPKYSEYPPALASTHDCRIEDADFGRYHLCLPK